MEFVKTEVQRSNVKKEEFERCGRSDFSYIPIISSELFYNFEIIMLSIKNNKS